MMDYFYTPFLNTYRKDAFLTYYWTPMQQTPPSTLPPSFQGAMPREESYIENIFRLNRGKPGTFYFSFDNTSGLNTKAVRGVVEAAGRDHVILRELKTNHRFLFPMVYFDYAEFDEELAYFTQTP